MPNEQYRMSMTIYTKDQYKAALAGLSKEQALLQPVEG